MGLMVCLPGKKSYLCNLITPYFIIYAILEQGHLECKLPYIVGIVGAECRQCDRYGFFRTCGRSGVRCLCFGWFALFLANVTVLSALIQAQQISPVSALIPLGMSTDKVYLEYLFISFIILT